MKTFRNSRLMFLLAAVLLLSGGQAMGEITLSSAVKIEKAVYFQKSDGGTVQVKPGIYDVAQNGEKQLNLDPLGNGGPIAVQAIPSGHDLKLDFPTASLVASPDKNADKQHLVLWLPDGLALEAVGSIDGAFTRSTQLLGEEAVNSDDHLSVIFNESISFKTPGGEAKSIQPGVYYLGLLANGVQLSPVEKKGESIAVLTQPLDASTAMVLPRFNDNPDLEALIILPATGQTLVAIGSHTGVFSRGNCFGAACRGLNRAFSTGGRPTGMAPLDARPPDARNPAGMSNWQMGQGRLSQVDRGQPSRPNPYIGQYRRQMPDHVYNGRQGLRQDPRVLLAQQGVCQNMMPGR
jgi:hypothetical protein